MKRITVNAYEVALITKRGKLINVLFEGNHWISFWNEYQVYSTTRPMELNSTELVLIADSDLLKGHWTVVDILDNQLGIEYRNGKFSRVLNTGQVAYWNSPMEYKVTKVDTNDIEVSKDIPTNILMNTSLLHYLRVFPVESYQKGLLYIDGKFVKSLDSGVYHFWKTNVLAVVKTVDTRLQYLDVSGQELLTKDKAGIRINLTAQYQVKDIEKALVDTKDYEKQLYSLLQLSLREYISTLTLDQMLASKEVIGPHIVKSSQAAAALLGVEIVSGGIKDIILPGEMKEIMNQVLVAQKKAQANTIMRQEETASTRSLLNTAKLMEQNAMLLKLKEMEYMEKISEKVGEITLNGGGGVIEQLKKLVVAE